MDERWNNPEYIAYMQTQPTLTGHGRMECTCGAMIVQCRCPRGHDNPLVIPHGCIDCWERWQAHRTAPLDPQQVA